MTREQLMILDKLPQFATEKRTYGELSIYKNDPKNGNNDYWAASYGNITLSGYYSLAQLLADLADECLKHNYAEPLENALITNN